MKTKKGFTLIELMIVVAIIGILAAIAIPKFADLIRKSKEGATKGSMGAMRSALTIYYGEQEGIYPMPVDDVDATTNAQTLTVANNNTEVFRMITGPFLTKYLDKAPTVKLGINGISDTDACVYNVDILAFGLSTDHDGKWWYRGPTYGEMHVFASNQLDTKGVYVTSW